MSLFLNIYRHLLPRSPAWQLTFEKTLQRFFEGLTGFPADVRQALDLVWLDCFPATTRHVPLWLTQFGIEPGADDAADRLQIDTAWKAQGGQSPSYLETVLQGAGFPLHVHEWWSDVPAFAQVFCGDTLAQCGEPLALCSSRTFPYFVRDPRNYTQQPVVGTFQCSDFSDGPQCSDFSDGPQCNSFLANEPGYLVNLDLSRSAPPPITATPPGPTPKDDGGAIHDFAPEAWSYFFYLGGPNFPDRVTVPASRRDELERLVLKLRPLHLWVVMLVDYAAEYDPSALATFYGQAPPDPAFDPLFLL